MSSNPTPLTSATEAAAALVNRKVQILCIEAGDVVTLGYEGAFSMSQKESLREMFREHVPGEYKLMILDLGITITVIRPAANGPA